MSLKSRLIYWLYGLITTVIAPLGMLYLMYKKRRDPPYGRRACELLGHYSTGFRNCIWFHTVSVGEAIAARPLIKAFMRRHPKLTVLVTTTTTSGAREIEKIEGINHVFAPLDSPLAVWRFLRNFNPSALYIMETELWPSLLNVTHAWGTRICIINARMPEKTCLKYLDHRTLTLDLISSKLDLVLCQTCDDMERFERIGVPADRLRMTGSLKYDLSPDEPRFRAARHVRMKWADLKIIGAISTHDGEEAMIIETFYAMKEQYPDLRLVLVPRHHAGTARAVNFLNNIHGSFALRTNLNPDLSNFTQDVLIGNSMGEIELYLGLCDIIIMGGSFVDVGGHNPLEPAFFSLPVITGPFYYNFDEQYDNLIENGAAYVANDHRRLFAVIKMFLDDSELMVATGMRAFDIQQNGRGATRKTLNEMEGCLRMRN